MEEFIRIENLSKHYHKTNFFGQKTDEVVACNNVSLSILQGETLGLVGESGSGKTTLGKMILGFEEPTAGEIYIKDQPAREFSQSIAAKNELQIIFQDPYSALNPSMSAHQLVAEPLLIDSSKRVAYEVAEAVLEQVGITGTDIHKKPSQFSGGQRQRIGIARAIATNPSFVMCDEPVSALDVSIQAQILNLLMDLQDEYDLTYLFISHDLSIVRSISTRIAVMYLGTIVEIAETEELFRNPIHPYTKKLLAAIPEISFNNENEETAVEVIEAGAEEESLAREEHLYTEGVMTQVNDFHYVLMEK